jgi:hypothetical protein
MDEISILKKEIERLNTIISALIVQVDSLKKENSSLRKSASPEIVPDGVPTSDNGIKNGIYTDVRSEMGTNNVLYTNVTSEKGTNNIFSTDVTNENGIKNSISTNVRSEIGTKNVQSPIPRNDIGIKTVPETISSFHLPSIEDNHINRNLLATATHHHLPLRTHRNKAYSVACELLLLHNSGHASSDELRKAAGLSKPGFAKHFPKLKRGGFIYKAGPRKYMLTEKSKQMIYEVFASHFKKQ